MKTSMDIDKAIESQIKLIENHTMKLVLHKGSDARLMGECFVLKSLTSTLMDMIQARDEGKQTW